MVLDSILLMFWTSLGLFQIIASWAQLEGLSFFTHRTVGYVFGAGNVIAAFCWFFITVEIGSAGPGGQHDDQFISFTLGGGGALVFTWIVSSIVKSRSLRQSKCSSEIGDGIDAFRRMTFFQVVRHSLGRNEEER